MSFDAKFLEMHGNKLKSDASSIVGWFVFKGILIGLVSALFCKGLIPDNNLSTTAAWTAFIFIVIYFLIAGQKKSYQLKVDANIALALVEIERNTRNPS